MFGNMFGPLRNRICYDTGGDDNGGGPSGEGPSPQGGSRGAGLGGPGAPGVSAPSPSGQSPDAGGGGGDGGNRDADTQQTQQQSLVDINPTLSSRGRSRGISDAQGYYDQIIQDAINEAQGNFTGAIEQRGLTSNSEVAPGRGMVSDLFNPDDVRGEFGTIDQWGNYVDPQGNVIQAAPGTTNEVDAYTVDRGGIRSQVGDAPGNSYFDNILTQEQERLRNTFSNELNQFAPEGFATNRVGEGFADDAIQQMLGERYGQAFEQVENASARGQLTDVGYDKGVGELEGQRETARSTLGDIGQDVVGSLRQSLRDRASQARSTASNFQLGQNFDPNNVQEQLDTIYTRGQEGLPGDIRSQLGSEPLFQPEKAVTRGGIGQGQANQGRLSLIGALQERNRSRDSGRGLGTQGAF